MTRTLSWARILTLILCFCVLPVLPGACGGDSDSAPEASPTSDSAAPDTASSEVAEVRAMNVPWIGYAPFYIAAAEGLDTENGIKLDIQTVGATKELTSAIGSGAVDTTLMGAGQTLVLSNQGIRLRVVQLHDISLEDDALVAGPDVSAVEDLAGKTVGMEAGATGDFMLRSALEKAGLGFDEIEAVELPGSDAAAALNAGRVDAAVTYEPFVTPLQQDGFEVIATAADNPGIVSDFMVVTEDFASSEPDTLVNLLRTWEDGVAFLRENPEEGQRLTADALGVDPAEIETSFAGLKITSLQESIDFFQNDWPTLAPTYVKYLAEIGQVESGELTADEAVAIVDTTFAENAAAMR